MTVRIVQSCTRTKDSTSKYMAVPTKAIGVTNAENGQQCDDMERHEENLLISMIR